MTLIARVAYAGRENVRVWDPETHTRPRLVYSIHDRQLSVKGSKKGERVREREGHPGKKPLETMQCGGPCRDRQRMLATTCTQVEDARLRGKEASIS